MVVSAFETVFSERSKEASEEASDATTKPIRFLRPFYRPS
jgi:hypothetical protein